MLCQGADPFGMRDRKTVFIYDELVMRPFDIAKGATFSLETFYYLLSIALHRSMLIENQNYAIIMHNMLRKKYQQEPLDREGRGECASNSCLWGRPRILPNRHLEVLANKRKCYIPR